MCPLQLADSGFPVRLTTWLQHYGVRTSDIQIEITESCLVEPAGIAARVLAQLQHMGVRIALDDFGTGFSSLSQIRNLPINTIKLDKSFVNELRTSTEAGVLVTSIITLAHNLRMQVVAEGVELKDQLVYLKTAGCDVAQGYFSAALLPRRRQKLCCVRAWCSCHKEPSLLLKARACASATAALCFHRSAHTASRLAPGAHHAHAGRGWAAGVRSSPPCRHPA